MPSAVRPELRWKSVMAAAVCGPRMPSTRSAKKPRSPSLVWRSATSSPAEHRPPLVEQPVAELVAGLDEAPQVWAPQVSSTRSPRDSWKWRTAEAVCSPYDPASSPERS